MCVHAFLYMCIFVYSKCTIYSIKMTVVKHIIMLVCVTVSHCTFM